jgi:hypothetical protein
MSKPAIYSLKILSKRVSSFRSHNYLQAMNAYLPGSVKEKLIGLDERVRKSASVVIFGYSAGIAGALLLYAFFPFGLSRIGSAIIIIALAHMIWNVHQASGEAVRRSRPPIEDSLLEKLGMVEAQIRLVQSVLHNVPFVVGTNLFWMGLPGTGSAESKAWQDCWFLLATVILFSSFYIVNQQTVRKELLPLRQELASFVLQRENA